MKQIVQNMSSGDTLLLEMPGPQSTAKSVLISTTRSLISAGTERMLVEFGKSNLVDKARQQPDKVREVLVKVKTDGLQATVGAVRSKLDQPLPLGYCNVGVVIESNVPEFLPGDRVASNGPHADLVRVPANLCAMIPDQVDDETASFTVLASIGLQGIRLVRPTLGESFVVTGLGLIGLLTVQLLRAQGCRVLGIDLDSKKCDLARSFGAETVDLSKREDPIAAARAFSRGVGVDGVLITASTKSSEPVHQAAEMCRKRGRIILVGVTGLELSRADFYKKELSFQVSCSYGPGRYDPNYEEKGQDYPIGYVRWTEQRNFIAVLDLMAAGKVQVDRLISHRFSFEEAVQAYDVLTQDKSTLGILLEYPVVDDKKLRKSTVRLHPPSVASEPVGDRSEGGQQTPVMGIIGAGNYASRILIPAFKAAGTQLHTLVSSGGLSGAHHGKKAGFLFASTDVDAMLSKKEINTVAIVTRHNSHADFVCQALENGKNVFVEKPLALTLDELEKIDSLYQSQKKKPRLMVGFNRRFAPQIVKMKELLTHAKVPKSFIITINAGEIPADHWTQDPQVGGGRIIGEGCHFIDLMRFLANSPITTKQAHRMGRTPGVEVCDDKVAITLGFSDGSFGTIHYLANGGKKFPKERIEVFCGNAVLQLDNFRKMTGYGWPGFKKMSLWQQDKGQKTCVAAFIKAVEQGSEAPIPFEELMEVSRVTIEIAEALQNE